MYKKRFGILLKVNVAGGMLGAVILSLFLNLATTMLFLSYEIFQSNPHLCLESHGFHSVYVLTHAKKACIAPSFGAAIDLYYAACISAIIAFQALVTMAGQSRVPGGLNRARVLLLVVAACLMLAWIFGYRSRSVSINGYVHAGEFALPYLFSFTFPFFQALLSPEVRSH